MRALSPFMKDLSALRFVLLLVEWNQKRDATGSRR